MLVECVLPTQPVQRYFIITTLSRCTFSSGLIYISFQNNFSTRSSHNHFPLALFADLIFLILQGSASCSSCPSDSFAHVGFASCIACNADQGLQVQYADFLPCFVLVLFTSFYLYTEIFCFLFFLSPPSPLPLFLFYMEDTISHSGWILNGFMSYLDATSGSANQLERYFPCSQDLHFSNRAAIWRVHTRILLMV